MEAFRYQENELYCEDITLSEIVEEFGTPLYVYSKSQIVENFRAIRAPLAELDHVVCYALKANANPAILKILAKEGAGADVVSGGELYLALKAGFPPQRVTFAGVGKREDEIEYALKSNIFTINAESSQELQLISLIALRLGVTARVTLRINPDIDAQSHPYITTGLKQNKFGIAADEAEGVLTFASTLPNMKIVGVHTHIGSQITKVEPFVEAARFLVRMAKSLRENGITVEHIDMGGGFGVQYVNTLIHESLPVEPDSMVVPRLSQFMDAMVPVLKEAGCPVWFEPGRSVVADAGVLLTRVLYTKVQGAKKFIITDAGMNDLIRPSLYNAYHQIVPVKIQTYEQERAEVVGPICETGDFFAHDRLLPKMKKDDILAVMTVGAYGFAITSNYNARLRPAEILVNADRVRVIRERQTIEQL